MKTIQETQYPQEWARRFEYLSVLNLQDAVDPHLSMYQCAASVSTLKTMKSRSPKKTEFAIMKVNPFNGRQIDFEMDKPITDPISQHEALEDFSKNLGELFGVVLHSRSIIEKVPNKIEDIPAFQGAENVYSSQVSTGSFPHKFREQTGLAVVNTYDWTRNELMTRRIVKQKNDPSMKKNKGILITKDVHTDTAHYNTLGNAGIRLFEEAILPQRKKWWAGIAEPIPFGVLYNHSVADGHIYRDISHNFLVGV